MEILTKDQLLAKASDCFKEIEIEEFGGSVLVRGLTAKEQLEYEDELERHAKEEKTWNDAGIFKIQKCVYGPDKKPLFPSEGDKEALCSLPNSVMTKLHFAVNKLSNIADFDEFLKKCGWAVIEDFSSASASPSESTTPTDSKSASA